MINANTIYPLHPINTIKEETEQQHSILSESEQTEIDLDGEALFKVHSKQTYVFHVSKQHT